MMVSCPEEPASCPHYVPDVSEPCEMRLSHPIFLVVFGDAQLFVRMTQGSHSGAKYVIWIISLFLRVLLLFIEYSPWELAP